MSIIMKVKEILFKAGSSPLTPAEPIPLSPIIYLYDLIGLAQIFILAF